MYTKQKLNLVFLSIFVLLPLQIIQATDDLDTYNDPPHAIYMDDIMDMYIGIIIKTSHAYSQALEGILAMVGREKARGILKRATGYSLKSYDNLTNMDIAIKCVNFHGVKREQVDIVKQKILNYLYQIRPTNIHGDNSLFLVPSRKSQNATSSH